MSQIQEIANSLKKITDHLIISPLYQSFYVESVKKYEKHTEQSQPILSGVLTPYEAFKEGFERAIASFIKLGQEGLVKKKIVSEVQIKNVETELLEQLIKNLLKDFDSVKFVKKDNRYLAISGGKLYQFSTLLERANFNLISLREEDFKGYQNLIDNNQLLHQPYLQTSGYKPSERDFDQADPEHLCRTLSFAEKEAINVYTGNFYRSINALMRGQIDDAINYNYLLPSMLTPQAKANQTIKEGLLHIALAVSGLNKLPDYIPPNGPDGKPAKYLYRAEGYVPDDVLAKRKWSVLQGGEITIEMGFISAAFEKPAGGFFNENAQAAILIKNLKGKKVTPLSQFGNTEREILLPPTQMQWLYHKDIITDVFKKQMALFIAKPVTVNLPSNHTTDMFVKTIDPNDNLIWGVDTEWT